MRIVVRCENCGVLFSPPPVSAEASHTVCGQCDGKQNLPSTQASAVETTPKVERQPRSPNELVGAAFRAWSSESGGCFFAPLYLLLGALSMWLGARLTSFIIPDDVPFTIFWTVAWILSFGACFLCSFLTLYAPVRLIQRLVFKVKGW